MNPRRTGQPSRFLLAAVVAGIAGLLALAWWLWRGYGLASGAEALSSTGVGACFAAAGLVAWRLRPRSRTGPLMVLLGAVLLIENLSTGLMLATDMPGREWTVLAGVPANWLKYAVGAQLLLGYPTGRLPGPLERRIIAAAYIVFGAGAIALLLTKTWVPVCAGWCGPSPIPLVADPGLYLGIRSVLVVASVGLAAVVLVLLARRAARSSPRQRRVLGFTIVTAALTVLLITGAQFTVLAFYAWNLAPLTAVGTVLSAAASWAAVAALPAAFLVGLLKERLAFASVGSLVARLEHVAADRVEMALAEVLQDPTLRMAFPAAHGLLDVSGRPIESEVDQSRSITSLGDPPGGTAHPRPRTQRQPGIA